MITCYWNERNVVRLKFRCDRQRSENQFPFHFTFGGFSFGSTCASPVDESGGRIRRLGMSSSVDDGIGRYKSNSLFRRHQRSFHRGQELFIAQPAAVPVLQCKWTDGLLPQRWCYQSCACFAATARGKRWTPIDVGDIDSI